MDGLENFKMVRGLRPANGRTIRCSSCGYSWNTRTTRLNVSCPNCLRKVKTPEVEVKE